MLDAASTAYLRALSHGDTAVAERLARVLDTATELEHARREAAGRVRGEAHAFAAAGVPVFPVQPRGKRPLTAHGFKDATTDPAQVDAWWAQWPDANLGVRTGVRFDVIDVDGTAGVAAMYTGDPPLIASVQVLGVALTSRDGGRHVYVPAAGMPNKTALLPQVDYRGAGGYVVAPPSVGANGRRYEWLRRPADLDGWCA